jgi:predicted transcriptional regulator
MDNEAILKANLEDLPDDQKELIEQAEEFHEKCLLSYSRTRDSIIQKALLPSVLLHGQSEDVEA